MFYGSCDFTPVEGMKSRRSAWCGEIDQDHGEVKQDHGEISSPQGVDNGKWLASGLAAFGNHESRMPQGCLRKHFGVCFVEREPYSACRLAEGCLLEEKHAGLCDLHFLERGQRRRTAQETSVR